MPCQAFRTADGWVMAMCMLEKFWQTFVEGIGNPVWAAEPRFASFAERRKVRDELTARVDEIFGTQPTAHWTQLFAGRIPIAPVLDIAQALDNPHVRDVDMLQDVSHPQGTQRLLRNPIKLDGQRLSGKACPPLNTDAGALLRELGYSEADCARLLGA